MGMCEAVKDMVFKQVILGWSIEIRQFWSRIGYACNLLIK